MCHNCASDRKVTVFIDVEAPATPDIRGSPARESSSYQNEAGNEGRLPRSVFSIRYVFSGTRCSSNPMPLLSLLRLNTVRRLVDEPGHMQAPCSRLPEDVAFEDTVRNVLV
jgi:hypothetical protein